MLITAHFFIKQLKATKQIGARITHWCLALLMESLCVYKVDTVAVNTVHFR